MAVSRDTGIWLDIIRERICYKAVNNFVKKGKDGHEPVAAVNCANPKFQACPIHWPIILQSCRKSILQLCAAPFQFTCSDLSFV